MSESSSELNQAWVDYQRRVEQRDEQRRIRLAAALGIEPDERGLLPRLDRLIEIAGQPPCCEFHKPGRCCDPDDCAPCCARCPDPCPLDSGRRGKPDFDLPQLPGFAAHLADTLNSVYFDCTVRFHEVTDAGAYVYRVRDTDHMIFYVEHYDEKADALVRDAAYEVSVRRAP